MLSRKLTNAFHLLVAVSLVLFSLGLSVLAQEPQESEIGATFSFRIPAVWTVESFAVEATQNVGTEARPIYVSRFRSDVRLEQDTFSVIGQIGARQILRPVLFAGHRLTLFGFVESTVEEGRYRHLYDLQGAALSGAGRTLAEIGGLTVLEGSKELAALRLEAETAQERARIAAEEQQRALELETARLRAEAEARAQEEIARAEEQARLEAARIEARNTEALAVFAGTWVSGPVYRPDGFPMQATQSGGVYQYRLSMPEQPSPRGMADVALFSEVNPEEKITGRASYQYDAERMALIVHEPGRGGYGEFFRGAQGYRFGSVWQLRLSDSGVRGDIIDSAGPPVGTFAEFIRE